VNNESFLVAVIVGTKGVSGASDTDDLCGLEATESDLCFVAASLLLRAASGRALLDSTEIEKATADMSASPASITGMKERNRFSDFAFVRTVGFLVAIREFFLRSIGTP
jgi:hypothetical protein